MITILQIASHSRILIPALPLLEWVQNNLLPTRFLQAIYQERRNQCLH